MSALCPPQSLTIRLAYGRMTQSPAQDEASAYVEYVSVILKGRRNATRARFVNLTTYSVTVLLDFFAMVCETLRGNNQALYL